MAVIIRRRSMGEATRVAAEQAEFVPRPPSVNTQI